MTTAAGVAITLEEDPPIDGETFEGVPDDCFEWTEDPDGTITCTSHDDLMSSDPLGGPGDGIPAAFGVFFVLVLVAGILGSIWKVSTARRMARDAGMDVGDATAMSLLTDNGLEATYVASQLRGATPQPARRERSVEDRLRELDQLHEQGLITTVEYAERRAAIINSL